jgi:hypothetical protein
MSSQELPASLLAQRCPFSAKFPYLPLYRGTYLGEGKAKFHGSAPANCCTFDDERVAFTLWKDATLEFYSNRNRNGTRDATAPGGEVSQISLTSHHPSLR